MFHIGQQPDQRQIISKWRFKRLPGPVTIPKTPIRPPVIFGKLDEFIGAYPSARFVPLRNVDLAQNFEHFIGILIFSKRQKIGFATDNFAHRNRLEFGISNLNERFLCEKSRQPLYEFRVHINGTEE